MTPSSPASGSRSLAHLFDITGSHLPLFTLLVAQSLLISLLLPAHDTAGDKGTVLASPCRAIPACAQLMGKLLCDSSCLPGAESPVGLTAGPAAGPLVPCPRAFPGDVPWCVPGSWFLSALPTSHLSGSLLLQTSAHFMAMPAAL